MMSLKKCTVTKYVFVLATLLLCAQTFAGEVVGTVINLSGPLIAKRADGVAKVLSQKSSVEQGDTLISEKNTYARIKFIDNSEITLRPNSQFKIENFTYDEAKQENDNAIFTLIKGGLRAVTGLIGKRSRDRFGLSTPTATIGIRGTIFVVEFIAPEQSDVAAYGFASMAAFDSASILMPSIMNDVPLHIAPIEFAPAKKFDSQQSQQLAQLGNYNSTSSRAPGLYVQVLDGMIHVSNTGGMQNFSAGQFGYTPSITKPPVILPSNPGIQFTPPPAFSSNTAVQQSGTTSANKAGSVDCEVR
mgnify:CR=1 FL=1